MMYAGISMLLSCLARDAAVAAAAAAAAEYFTGLLLTDTLRQEGTQANDLSRRFKYSYRCASFEQAALQRR